MFDVTNAIYTGVAMILAMVVGFVACKSGYLKFTWVSKLNRFILQAGFFPLMMRGIATKKFSEIDFKPVIATALGAIVTYIVSLLLFLFPVKDKFKFYISTTLPSCYINYVAIGPPVFNAIWGEKENFLVSILPLSNDPISVPIFLILVNIWISRKERASQENPQIEQIETIEQTEQSELESSNENKGQAKSLKIHDKKQKILKKSKKSKKHIKVASDPQIEQELNPDDGVIPQESPDFSQINPEVSPNFEEEEAKKEMGFCLRTFLLILKKLGTNPIIMGLIFGIIWSAIGWKVPVFLDYGLDFLAGPVQGIALVTVGAFLAHNGLIACHWAHFLLCLVIRHVIFPIFVALFCKLMNMSALRSRQCTIMSSIASASASYILTEATNCGPEVSSTMLFWTSVLTVPVTIGWHYLLNALHIFME